MLKSFKTSAIAAGLISWCLATQAQECPTATWLRTGEPPGAISATDLISEMSARDVVLLGEHHDVADHHAWQLHTIAALHARRPDMAIGFEMFPRSAQPVLDRWVAGELTAQQFLAASRWEEVWNLPAELYLPLFEFARLHRVPMIALNIDRKLTQAIAASGWDAIPEHEREGISRPAPAPKAYLDELEKVHKEHSPKTPFAHFVQSQQAWDRAMAQALAGRAGRGLVVGVIGSGHLRNGYGVPLQLKDLGVAKVGTLLPVNGSSRCADLNAGLADAVYVLPEGPATKPPPPRLGVRLEQRGEEVAILEVSPGSLADRTGLQKDDVVVSAAGKRPKRMGELIDVVRRQPDGTWLPLQVRRSGALRDLVVKFPPP